MITDRLTTFCDGTSVAESVGSALVGNQIPITNLRDVARGSPLYLVVTVGVAVDSATDTSTIEFKLMSDDAAAINTSTGTVHYTSGAIAEASLTAGAMPVCVALPWEGNAYEEYLGLVITVAGEDVTAGNIDAFLTCVPQKNVHYPEYSGV